jgi:hypothetical protein
MCIRLLVTFAISNPNYTLLYVRVEDSTLGDIIILEGKKELPANWDSSVTQCSHLISNNH